MTTVSPPATVYRIGGQQLNPAQNRRLVDAIKAAHPDWSISKCIRTSKRLPAGDPDDYRPYKYQDPTGETATARALRSQKNAPATACQQIREGTTETPSRRSR